MALFLFTKAILEGHPIKLFNGGRMQRDFTYVGDIVEGVISAADEPTSPNPDWCGDEPDPSTSNAPWRIFNIGNNRPVELLRYIDVLEECLGRRAERELLPMQPGDVPATWAGIEALDRAVGYRPSTSIDVGVRQFVEWYREFYSLAPAIAEASPT
jgi:UDP-glucuronate 4-epimerase